MNAQIDQTPKAEDLSYSNRNSRLYGDILIVTPMSWQLVTYFLLIILVGAIVLLAFGNYRRVELANGVIVPDKGVALILPSRSGILYKIPVIDGQIVKKGQPLAFIQVDEYLSNGNTISEELKRAIRNQIDALNMRRDSIKRLYEAQRNEKIELTKGLELEVKLLNEQETYNTRMVDLALTNYDRLLGLLKRGLVSSIEVQQREVELLGKQLELAQLKQNLTNKKYQLNQAKDANAQISALAEAELSEILASASQMEQQLSVADSNGIYVLQAPINGVVTGIVGRVGQPAYLSRSLMSIIPENSVLQAEINITSSAIGFVRKGQKVALAIDTFPYQRFGTVEAKVISVSKSVIESPMATSASPNAYRLIAELDTFSVHAYGKNQPLIPGMTFVARISTGRQSLLEWLFDPIFAVARR